MDHEWCIPDSFLDTFMGLINEKKITYVVFTWGELLYDHHIATIVFSYMDLLEHNGIWFSINTNASFQDETVFKALSRYTHLWNVTISIDSLDEYENNFLRKDTKSVIANIKGFLERWYDPTILITLTKMNIDTILQTILGLHEMWIKKIFVNPVFLPVNNRNYVDLSIDQSKESILAIIDQLTHNPIILNNFYPMIRHLRFWADAFFDNKVDSKAVCQMCNEFIVLTPRWTIKDCFYRDKRASSKEVPECFSKICLPLFVINDFWK